MRISGLALVFLVLGHMFIMHIVDGGVDRIDYDFVSARWSGFFWRAYDWLLLALAMLHGAIGARGAIADHIRSPLWRGIAKTAALLGGVLPPGGRHAGDCRPSTPPRCRAADSAPPGK